MSWRLNIIKQNLKTDLFLICDFREFFYTCGATIDNFDKMVGNKICRQIPWRTDKEEHLKAWKEARTGYPWIDAIMTQLRKEGWIHHLAR